MKAARWAALCLLVAGCRPDPWVAPPAIAESIEPAAGQVHAFEEAAQAREERFLGVLSPGRAGALRTATLARGKLGDFAQVGADLFRADAPWAGGPAPPLAPLRSAQVRADATRCAACHHEGGEAGAGGFADLAFFGGDGDDVLTARRRLPRMLAGSALLSLAARDLQGASPFGWAPGRPTALREMVAWSARYHLGQEPSDEEVDALTVHVALLPPPVRAEPPAELALRTARGAALFEQMGCASCHRPRLAVRDPRLPLSSGRVLDLSSRLSVDGQPPFVVEAFTDLQPHHMGSLRDDPGDEDLFVTAPLWGLSTRVPFLHDGRAATVEEAILAHDGEARTAREKYAAAGTDQRDLHLFLTSLSRPFALRLRR